MTKIHAKNTKISLIVLVLMLVGFAAIVFSTGDLSDDYWYRCEFVKIDASADSTYTVNYAGFENCIGPNISSLNQIPSSFSNHWQYWNNARLSSLLMMLSNLVPDWLVDLLQIAAMTLMALMLLRLACRNRWQERPVMTLLVLWGIWVVLPWYNQMLSTVYMMTYIWGTALMLSAIWCFEQGKKPLWAVCLLGLVAAMMHEAITLPLLCGLVVYLIVNRTGKRGWIFVASVAAGLLLITLNPSIFARVGWDNHGVDSLSKTLHFLITRMWILPVALILIALVCWRQGKKYTLNYLKDNSLWITVALVSTAFGCYTGQFDRQVWIGKIALIILLARLIPFITDEYVSEVYQAVGVLGIALCLFLIFTAQDQLEGKKEFERVAEQIVATNDTEPLYVDVRDPYSLKWWTLQIPEMYHNQYSILRRNQRAYLTGGKSTADPVVLPTEYKGKPLDQLPKIQGTAGLRGVFPWYYSAKRIDMSYGKLTYTLQNGNKRVEVPLVTEEHPIVHKGDTVYFYRPAEWRRQDYGAKPIKIDR